MKKQIVFFCAILFLACSNPENKPLVESTENESWALTGFEKVDSLNPILKPSAEPQFVCPLNRQAVRWEERNVLNPSAVVKDDKVYLFYRAQDVSGTSRIGLAVSSDGLHFEKRGEPVFYPDNDEMKKYEWNYQKDEHYVFSGTSGSNYFDGAEDPRVVESEDGIYIMTYTSYDGKTARLCLASSKDMENWTKHGPVLSSEKYIDNWSKSGAIVVKQDGNKMVATKINGKYRMYFGDTDIFMASSDDLIRWEVAENKENNKLIEVLHPRPGYFDSRLVEPGPFALLKDDGILLIYNGSNALNFNDPELPPYTYAAGQALFNKEEPWKLMERAENYFIHPDKAYEKVGEVNEVCFVEGLVYFRDKWFLYYGTADSKIAVAVKN
jgi:predicted GH43/DUF377 family glycosyl hydrolase